MSLKSALIKEVAMLFHNFDLREKCLLTKNEEICEKCEKLGN